jgi:2-methylisocitrate lyase-like PEP mutase family enzyme
MPFDEYMVIIKRIAASVRLPVTIDMEMGYGKTKEAIYGNIQRLLDAGVVGINIEDSVITNGKRTLGAGEDLANRITYFKDKLAADGKSLFINVRCDTYLLGIDDTRKESTRRAKLYESAGADGLFLPVISKEDDIAAAVSSTRLPINVMCIPGLPNLDQLQSLGVRRASMGPFLQNKTYHHAKEIATKVITDRNFSSIL